MSSAIPIRWSRAWSVILEGREGGREGRRGRGRGKGREGGRERGKEGREGGKKGKGKEKEGKRALNYLLLPVFPYAITKAKSTILGAE